MKGVTAGCNLNPHVVFVHINALMAEARIAAKLRRRVGGNGDLPNQLQAGVYNSMKEMVLNVLLSYDKSNLVLEEQQMLFPDKVQRR